MHKTAPSLMLFICILVTMAIAVVKYFYPELIYFNSGMLLIILLTIFLKDDISTYVFGLLSLLMILGSFFLSTEVLLRHVIIQQILVFIVAVVTTGVVLYIKKLNRSIEAERKQMNALFEFATEGIILTNTKREIILINPEAQRLFMYDIEEVMGKQIDMLIQKRNNALPMNSWLDYYENPPARNVEHKRHLDAIKKNGDEFPIEISLSHYSQQNEVFVLAFIIDISERKESENKLVQQKDQLEKITHAIRKMNIELENKVSERTLILREALQELERSQIELSEALNKEKELNEIKSRFVSMASHEFRTPLSTVLSSASLVSKYPLTEDYEKREKHIRRIKSSVQHLNDLLEDFLNLGKIEEGRVFTQVTDFDLKEFLHDVFDEMKTGLKDGQVLKLNFEGELSFVTDKRLLKNVLINLLSNAIKFSNEDKPIWISVNNSGTKLVIQVKDEGMGIAHEDMPHLFSTFYRGRNAVNVQGTGLGLHIVKRYVDMLEGHITLSSELNEGTTFNLGLPNLKELA